MKGCDNNISLEGLAWLLTHGNADPAAHIHPETGYTALHYAAIRGNAKLIPLLIDHGWDPNAQNHKGETPLHLTLWRYHAHKNQAIAALIAGGANPNRHNLEKQTPYRLAIAEGFMEAAALMKSEAQAAEDATHSPEQKEIAYLKQQIIARLKAGKIYGSSNKESATKIYYQDGAFWEAYKEHVEPEPQIYSLDTEEIVVTNIRNLYLWADTELEAYRAILGRLS